MEELTAEIRDFEARRERLKLPSLDRERGPTKKKHLLHHPAEKVLIHDRRTIEVWYCLPNRTPVRTAEYLAPRMCRSTNRQSEPEVWFRIVHIAQEGHNGGSVAAYREQTVEIALGPKGAFENGNIGALARRVATAQVVSASPLRRDKLKPPREPKAPRVVELLRKAIEWRRQLDAGEVRNQTEIAGKEDITRARVTQIMGMLRLAPEIQEHILSMPDVVRRPPVAERMLRAVETNNDFCEQVQEVHMLLMD